VPRRAAPAEARLVLAGSAVAGAGAAQRLQRLQPEDSRRRPSKSCEPDDSRRSRMGSALSARKPSSRLRCRSSLARNPRERSSSVRSMCSIRYAMLAAAPAGSSQERLSTAVESLSRRAARAPAARALIGRRSECLVHCQW
jgi:hypothetical protein